jgi:cell cycle checkpoint control protein RAD9A
MAADRAGDSRRVCQTLSKQHVLLTHSCSLPWIHHRSNVTNHLSLCYVTQPSPAFTKALTCLSKYGEELAIYATADTLSLSATNSSKSAYCRFKYEKQFFSKYRIGQPGVVLMDNLQQTSVTGQLLTKVILESLIDFGVNYKLHYQSLLSILKHRTVEKAVERCEMSVVEASQPGVENDEQDGLESKLVVRLHCKHGVCFNLQIPF